MPDPITIKMPDSPPYADGDLPQATDLVWVWDMATGVLRKTPISALPFTDGGGGSGGGAAVPSPFLVTNDSPNYSYDAGTNTVKILDARLLNKILYPVYTTQYGTEFETSLLTYNAVDPDDDTKGSVVITGFQLQDGSHITITVPGSTDPASDTVYAALLADVALLKQIAAPFAATILGPNGAKVWWLAGADLIPTGWQECVAMRGVIPLAQDSTSIDPDLTAPVGTAGGAKMHTNSLEEMVPHNHTLATSNSTKTDNDGADPVRSTEVGTVNTKGGIGTDKSIGVTGGVPDPITAIPAPAPFNMMNPYVIGIWIEFVGV